METMKQEIAAFLKLLGSILVAALGTRMLLVATGTVIAAGGVAASGSGWLWIPKVCGTVLVVVGTAVVVYQVLQRVLGAVRINVNSPLQHIPVSPPPPPPPPPPAPEGRTRRKAKK